MRNRLGVGFDGFGVGPVVHFLKKEQSGDRVEFLGRSSDGRIEVFAEFPNGHEVEQGSAKEPLPAHGNALASQRRDEAIEGVKETVLSWIDGMAHGNHNSMIGMML